MSGPPEVQVKSPGIQDDEWIDLRNDPERKYYAKNWYPASSPDVPAQPNAAMLFVHGFGEHVGRYSNIFKVLAQGGIQVTGYDQRGYGRSWHDNPDPDKHHGWTTWSDQLRDVESMIRLLRSRLDERWGKDKVPIFVFGHSMGGGISVGFFTRPPGSGPSEEVKKMVKGVILSAPWLDIHFPINTWLAGQLMGSALALYGRLRMPLGPRAETLSRDPAVTEWVRNDPLCDTNVYTRGLYDPLINGPKLVSQDYKRWPEHLPLMVMHGSGDLVTKWSSSEQLCKNLKAIGRPATFKSFDGLYHEMLFEPGGADVEVANAMVDFINSNAK